MAATTTCKQLLNEVCHYLYPGRVYEVTVGLEDKERLKMVNEVVNENLQLGEIDVTHFRIRQSRKYNNNKFNNHCINSN